MNASDFPSANPRRRKTTDKPELVLFDFDGTLADSFEAALAAGNEMAKKYGYRPLTADEAVAMRSCGVRQILKEANIPLRRIPAWLREFREKLAQSVPHLRPTAGIQDALIKLRAAEIELGIVTSNSLENVQRFLSVHGWTGWFSHLECGSGLFGKHRLIRRIVRRAGASPEAVFYVGDEERDIESARRSGVQSVAVTWGFNSREILEQSIPDHLFEHPHELEELT